MMRGEDRVELTGFGPWPAAGQDARPDDSRPRRRFLAVWYRCCHAYGRLYRNHNETAYEGRCPRCGARARAVIGPGGTTRQFFEAR